MKNENLIFGVLIILVILIAFLSQMFFPQKEYFTELYFTDPENLPKLMWPGYSYNFSFEIKSHEKETREYLCQINSELISFDEKITLEPGESKQFNITIIPRNLGKNSLVINLDNNNYNKHQEIFFIYNVEEGGKNEVQNKSVI